MAIFSKKTPEIQYTLSIYGMTCLSCVPHVEKVLQSLAGVNEVSVAAWHEARAIVRGSKSIEPKQLLESLQKEGYPGKLESHTRLDLPIKSKNNGEQVDLLVIGTGAAGMAGALKAARAGKKVVIVESGTTGGTCVNVGCVPSKTLIRAAEIVHISKNHSFEGIKSSVEKLDWKVLRTQKDSLVNELRKAKYESVLESQKENIRLVKGHARLQKDGSVEVAGTGETETFYPAHILIATGAESRKLEIPGSEDVEIFDSTSLMNLENLPTSLIVLGGRVIAVELGQAFSRLGVKVTLVQRSERLIPDYDPEISAALQESLESEGIRVFTSCTLKEVAQSGNKKSILFSCKGKDEKLVAGGILNALGRTPRSAGLGLEDAGIETDVSGHIIVDDRLRSSNPRVSAAGDVSKLPKFVYLAAKSGSLAIANAFSLEGAESLDLRIFPEVLFSDPPIARVGLSQSQAEKLGIPVVTSTLPMNQVPRSLAARHSDGLLKLVAHKSTRQVLGAQMMGQAAGEVIQSAAFIMELGYRSAYTVDDLARSIVPYLTQVEALKLAAQTFDMDVSQLSCCAG